MRVICVYLLTDIASTGKEFGCHVSTRAGECVCSDILRIFSETFLMDRKYIMLKSIGI